MTDRMTLTDIAEHVGTTRPSMYIIARTADFPRRGPDKRWSRTEVLNWLADNTVAVDAVRVAGLLVVRT